MTDVSPPMNERSSPPPVYSFSRVRTASPNIITPNDDQKSVIAAYEQVHVQREPQNVTNSSASVTAPENYQFNNESSVKIRISRGSKSSQARDKPLSVQTLSPPGANEQDPTRLSPSTPSIPRRKPLQEQSRNISDPVHKRISSGMSSADNSVKEFNHCQTPTRNISTPEIEVVPEVENFEPLKYHHQAEEAKTQEVEKRVSKLTIGTHRSGDSISSDMSTGRFNTGGPGSARSSFMGRGIARPDSGFSSTSELRGRRSSPQLSPAIRPSSHRSRSPDTRPLSYIDLLNVPYPQAAPSGTENLVNSGLRDAVGNNASLLSTRKTLEMYRANVKKTNDPAIQYEFAVFMVGAAQEEGLESDISTDSPSTEKSKISTKEDLLKEAKQILQKLCDRSYPFAQYYLADGYASGLFNKGREDWDRAFPLFLAASKHGHAEAGYRTALCYEYGWGCRVDGLKAVQFYQHAASKNHPGAMLRLGRACLTGDMGQTKKYREGIRWLKRAAESADFQYNQAPYDLGCLHETGFGPDVFRDESYAAQLYTKAADLGHVEANHRLGEAYEFGQLNCPKDPALSVHFYTGAAEQGHSLSQMALCAWYMVGVENVLEKDESEAYEWAKRAAVQGLPKAQYTIGYFTEMGIGCRRDPLEANVWYVRAADQDEERAKHRIAAIRAAATGADPAKAASGKKGKLARADSSNNLASPDGEKKKRFGIF